MALADLELTQRSPTFPGESWVAVGAVERLRCDPELAVEAAVEPPPSADGDRDGPLSFQQQLSNLADFCRQFLRLLDNVGPRLSPDERREVGAVLFDLRRAIAAFVEEEAA